MRYPDIDFTEKQAKAFLSRADITLAGGGNGGGKTGLGYRIPLFDVDDRDYRGFLAMESLEKCKLPGGLLDEVTALYPKFGAKLNKTEMRFDFKSGAEVKISFVGEEGRLDGGQLSYGFQDQVEQGTRAQAFSVVSRLRTKAKVRPRVVWSANPPPEGEEHWLTRMLDAGGYLLGDGYPDPEMDGALRYFCRSPETDDFIFADTAAELLPQCQVDQDGTPIAPYSFTFVQMLVGDNKYQSDTYKRALAILDEQTRLRRLRGKWKGLNCEGIHFKPEFFPIIHRPRAKHSRGVRTWDIAWAESKSVEAGDGKNTDPDWTTAPRMWIEPGDTFAIDDTIRFRGTPAHTERAIMAVANIDGPYVEIRIPKDPGAAEGIQSAWARKLGARGYTVRLTPDRGEKETRATPYIACAQRHQIKLLANHPSREVAHLLLGDFEIFEKCDGCVECGGTSPRRCTGDGVVRIVVPGLKKPDVSTLEEWMQSLIIEHVRFGRKSKPQRGQKGKLTGKKDQVDGCVAGYLYLTDPELLPAEHLDPDMPGLRELSGSARGFGNNQQRRVTGFGSGARNRPLRG